MFSGTNGGKGEREQHFERVTVVSLVMYSRWDGWRRLMCGAWDGKGGTAPHAAPSRDRSAPYVRTKVPNPKGEYNVVQTPRTGSIWAPQGDVKKNNKPPLMDAMSHHTQLLCNMYPVQILCMPTFLHVRAGEPFQGRVAKLTTIRKNFFCALMRI